MNEHIKELAEQADKLWDGASPEDSEWCEKFAELIIRECMSVADLPNDVSGKWDHLLPSEMIAEHFGIE